MIKICQRTESLRIFPDQVVRSPDPSREQPVIRNNERFILSREYKRRSYAAGIHKRERNICKNQLFTKAHCFTVGTDARERVHSAKLWWKVSRVIFTASSFIKLRARRASNKVTDSSDRAILQRNRSRRAVWWRSWFASNATRRQIPHALLPEPGFLHHAGPRLSRHTGVGELWPLAGLREYNTCDRSAWNAVAEGKDTQATLRSRHVLVRKRALTSRCSGSRLRLRFVENRPFTPVRSFTHIRSTWD